MLLGVVSDRVRCGVPLRLPILGPSAWLGVFDAAAATGYEATVVVGYTEGRVILIGFHICSCLVQKIRVCSRRCVVVRLPGGSLAG